MNRKQVFASALALGITGVWAFAEEGTPPPPPQPAPPLVAVLDADGDGVISAEEIADAATALLGLDINGDGALTQEELRPPPPEEGPDQPPQDERPGGPRPMPPGGGIMRHDTDGDGVVTLDEFLAPAMDAFDHIDVNGDGVIDEDEAAAVPPPPRRHPGRRACDKGPNRRGR